MGRRRVRRHPDGATDPRLPALLALQALLARAVAAPEAPAAPAWDRVDGVERYQCRHRDVEPAYWGVTEGRRAGGCDCPVVLAEDMSEEVFQRLSSLRKPFIIRGAMDSWGAMTRWGGDFFATGPWKDHVIQKGTANVKDIIEQSSACEVARILGAKNAGRKAVRAYKEACEGLHAKRAAWVAGHSKEGVKIGDFARQVFSDDRLVARETYGKYISLDTSLFSAFPEIWEENIDPPAYLFQGDYMPKKVEDFQPGGKEARGRKGVVGGSRSLLFGGKGSRAPLHLDGAGWTSWIAVVKGEKLIYMWHPDTDDKAAFGGRLPLNMVHLAKAEPFMENTPEIWAGWRAKGRAYGDRNWDWESYAVGSGNVGTHMPPMAPMECIVEEGEIVITWDTWHAAFNLEPGIGVTGNFLSSADLPGFIFRDFFNGGLIYLEVYEGITNERKHDNKDLGLKVMKQVATYVRNVQERGTRQQKRTLAMRQSELWENWGRPGKSKDQDRRYTDLAILGHCSKLVKVLTGDLKHGEL